MNNPVNVLRLVVLRLSLRLRLLRLALIQTRIRWRLGYYRWLDRVVEMDAPPLHGRLALWAFLVRRHREVQSMTFEKGSP